MDTSSPDLDDSSVSLGNGILTLLAKRHNPGGLRSPPDMTVRPTSAEIASRRERPLRVLGENWVGGRGQFREARANLRVARLARAQAGISNRYACIAHQPAPLRALHGASAKHGAKFFLAEGDEPLEVRRKKRALLRYARLEIRKRRRPARADSTGKRPGKCRSRKRAGPWARAIRAGSRRAIRS
jgi:hypothetical protein